MGVERSIGNSTSKTVFVTTKDKYYRRWNLGSIMSDNGGGGKYITPQFEHYLLDAKYHPNRVILKQYQTGPDAGSLTKEERPDFLKSLRSVKKQNDRATVRKKLKFIKKQYRVLPSKKHTPGALTPIRSIDNHLPIVTYVEGSTYMLLKNTPKSLGGVHTLNQYPNQDYTLFFGNAQNYDSKQVTKNFIIALNNRRIASSLTPPGGPIKKSLYQDSSNLTQAQVYPSVGDFRNINGVSKIYGLETNARTVGGAVGILGGLHPNGKKIISSKTSSIIPNNFGTLSTTPKYMGSSQIPKNPPTTSTPFFKNLKSTVAEVAEKQTISDTLPNVKFRRGVQTPGSTQSIFKQKDGIGLNKITVPNSDLTDPTFKRRIEDQTAKIAKRTPSLKFVHGRKKVTLPSTYNLNLFPIRPIENQTVNNTPPHVKPRIGMLSGEVGRDVFKQKDLTKLNKTITLNLGNTKPEPKHRIKYRAVKIGHGALGGKMGEDGEKVTVRRSGNLQKTPTSGTNNQTMGIKLEYVKSKISSQTAPWGFFTKKIDTKLNKIKMSKAGTVGPATKHGLKNQTVKIAQHTPSQEIGNYGIAFGRTSSRFGGPYLQTFKKKQPNSKFGGVSRGGKIETPTIFKFKTSSKKETDL